MSDPVLSSHAAEGGSLRRFVRSMGTRQRLPLIATLVVCVLLYTAASVGYANFFTLRNFSNFFRNNAVMGIAAVGMTFVILKGGIDLSVASLVACGSICIGMLVDKEIGYGMHPVAAMAIVITAATLVGAFMGALIQFFDLPPFLVTLGGLFFYRGLGLLINEGRVNLAGHEVYKALMNVPFRLPKIGWLGVGPLTISNALPVYLFFGVLAVGIYVSLFTSFGRNVYAVGGSEASAGLMGLPVARTKILVYALSGFCGALAAVAFTIDSGSGDSSAQIGMELYAIAAVVVGGTLLSGGVGQVAGTCLGVLIFGIIQAILSYQGDLSPAWSKIAVGVLLLTFVLLQKLIMPRREA
jgi:simple sugar transport system permease protein